MIPVVIFGNPDYSVFPKFTFEDDLFILNHTAGFYRLSKVNKHFSGW